MTDSQSDRSHSDNGDSFSLEDEDLSAASKAIQMQMRQQLGLWAAGLEICSVLFRQWTDSRRKALEKAMQELARAEAEPNPDKRAEMLVKALTDQTDTALKDLLAASMRATQTGLAHGQRLMKGAMRQALDQAVAPSGVKEAMKHAMKGAAHVEDSRETHPKRKRKPK